MGKPVAGGLCLQCFNFHGKCFSLKAGIPEFSKMIEISCLQVMKSTLTTILECLTYSTNTCQLCVPAMVEVSLKRLFGAVVVLCGSLQPKKLLKALNFNFYVPRHPPRWKNRSHYGMMFTRHLHLRQSHIQAKLYIYKTDYMMSLYTPTSVCIFSILFSIQFLICWQGEFV